MKRRTPADVRLLSGGPGAVGVLIAVALLACACADDGDNPSASNLKLTGNGNADLESTPQTPPVDQTDAAPQQTAPTVCPASFVTRVVDAPAYGPSAGFGQNGFPQIVYGPPVGAGDTQGSLDVLSLGKGGQVVVAFDAAIVDGDGPDFTIFENPFFVSGEASDIYAELGEVSVSDDGIQWHTFPCTSTAPPYNGCAGWRPVFSNPSNAISPTDTTVSGGDPFDLKDIGVARAIYVRIRDLTHAGNGTTAGFDLDAAVAMHTECP